MPTVPKWMGDAFESILSGSLLYVTVTETIMISPTVKRVRFQGNFSKVDFVPGHAVAFRVSDRDHRNYTPSFFDSKLGVCEILFHLHGNGPGSEFAGNMAVGDQMKMVPPRGRKLYTGKQATGAYGGEAAPGPATHFFFGDETSLGVFALFAQEMVAHGERYTGIMELDEANKSACEKLGLAVHTVHKSALAPGRDASALLLSLLSEPGLLANNCCFYLIGNGHAIQAFRKTLKSLPVSPAFKTQTYWMEGKKGL